MTTHHSKESNWEKRLESLASLLELDKDDGTPLYEDGDVRLGFKKKELYAFIRAELLSVAQETRGECIEIVKNSRLLTEKYGETYNGQMARTQAIADLLTSLTAPTNK